MATQGHNSAAGDVVKNIIERVERLQEEKKALTTDIAEIFYEAKSHGLDVKALRALIRLRAKDRNELAELNALVRIYADALGEDWDPLS